MTEQPATTDEQSDQSPFVQPQLHELASQSWNLELIISGAALFATLSLPGLLNDAFVYYRYHLMTDTSFLNEGLPLLAYSLTKGISYVLFCAFLANFVMRAFWVGLVGLLAVYPKGIRFEQLPFMSQYARDQHKQEMGSLEHFIIRLDRRCNVIFALAFLLAFALLMVVFAYSTIFLLFMGIQWLVPAAIYTAYSRPVLIAFFGFITFLGLVSTVLNLPRFREHPVWSVRAYRFSLVFRLLFWGFYKPMQYITLTFYSNISLQALKKRMGAFVFIFMLLLISFVLYDTFYMIRPNLFDTRQFFSTYSTGQLINTNVYDNLRTTESYIEKAAVQADIIREPYLRLFIAYPKQLDTKISKQFQEPVWPDSLTRKEKRQKQASWRLQALNQFFSILINDSLYQKPDFLFTQRDDLQEGITTVLFIDQLKPGRHTLKIMVPDSANKPADYHQIPFWYAPEK